MKAGHYNIEVLTHCFCAGAQQQQAEIRVPSIRGQVRWWFRVLGGSPEDEKAVFGGVHPVPGEGQHASARASVVRMRIDNPCTSTTSVNLPSLGWPPFGGRAYLLWPLRPNKDNKQMRGVIKPGAKFVLYVSFRPGTLSAQNACLLDRALRAWLLLGSLGTRSRRGFGSVWPIGGDLATPASLDELATALMDLGLPSDAKVITLNDGAPQVDDVLESAGQWLKQWRAGSDKSVPTPDRWGLHDHDATLGLGGKTTTYRQALGLPMTQRYSDDRGTFESRLADGDRWASPVHMKVARVGGKHVPVVVFLPSMAPPEGSEIFVSSRQTPARRKLKLDHGLLKAMMTPPQGGRLLLG